MSLLYSGVFLLLSGVGLLWYSYKADKGKSNWSEMASNGAAVIAFFVLLVGFITSAIGIFEGFK